jgi:RNA polymerase sigma factor (sigma-70 family)
VHGELVSDEKDYAAVLVDDEDGEPAFVSEKFRSIESEEAEHFHLDEFETKNSDPEEEKPAESVQKTPANNKGALNQRYREYKIEPNETTLDALLAETYRYAERVLILGGYTQRLDLSEAAQLATIKVWRNLKNFHGRSKFSSWANRIIKNEAVDEIRKAVRRRECELPDEEIFDGRESGCRRGKSGHLNDNWVMETSGVAGAPLPSWLMKAPEYARTDNPFPEDYETRAQILDQLIENLSSQDTIILHLFRCGRKPAQIGEFYKRNAKWASNQLARIKKRLQKEAKALAKSYGSTS